MNATPQSPGAHELVVLPTAEALALRAAEEFAEQAAEVLARASVFRVALSGGSTPRRLHELLAGRPFRERIAWEHVEFFWGDERSVPLDHPESNYRMAHDTLLGPLAIPARNIHPMSTPMNPIETGRASELPAKRAHTDARAYEAEIARAFGVPLGGRAPALDLVLLGLGPDGHTASLFPGNAALSETTRWVVGVNDAPKPPPERVTLTSAMINQAARVVFVVSGADKANALAKILEGPYEPIRFPAQLIAPVGGRRDALPAPLLWLVDRAAASRLRRDR